MPGQRVCNWAGKTSSDPAIGTSSWGLPAVLEELSICHLQSSQWPCQKTVSSCGRRGKQYKVKKRAQGQGASKCWAGTHTRTSGPKAWNIQSISLKLSSTSLISVRTLWHLAGIWSGHISRMVSGWRGGGTGFFFGHLECELQLRFILHPVCAVPGMTWHLKGAQCYRVTSWSWIKLFPLPRHWVNGQILSVILKRFVMSHLYIGVCPVSY